MDELTFSIGLLTPASDLITGAGPGISLFFGRAGNDIFYNYDPIEDANEGINIDILFGDLFDNTADEFDLIRAIAAGNPLAILDANIPSVGEDRFVLGDEFQPYYTSFDPLSLLTTNQFGVNEFTVLYDFDPQQDTIQLNGKKDDYTLLKLDSLPVQGFEFSGYALFSLQTGLPDLVSLIVQEPSVELELKDKDAFQFVGNKPKDKPKEKKVGQFGTTGLDFGYGVATDSNGNLYVTGTTSGSLNGPNKGSSDVWVTKFDSNGNQVLAKQFGSADGDIAYEITTDKYGNFYLAGSTSGSFVAGNNSPAGTDAWVAKYNKNGKKLWGRQVGENSTRGDFGFSTSGFGLQVDDGGNVYLSGLTINDNDPENGGKGILDFPVEDDSWVIKFDRNGNQQWFTKIVDPQQPSASPLAITPFFDESYDLAVDQGGNSYLVGWTQGLAKESDPSRLLLKYDAWVSKVGADGNVEWTQQFGSKDEGLEFAWAVDTDSKGNIYVTGWTTGELGTRDKEFEKSDSYDVFLTKFTPDGDQVWAKQIGSQGDDGTYFGDLVIDAYDNIFVSGYTNDKLGKGGSDKNTDGWVGRFDTNGNNKWIQQIGIKDKADYATGLAVNNAGQLFVTGFTEGFFGNGNNFQAQGAAVDTWIAQLDVKDGKVKEFTGNTGKVISINNPAPISTVDISDRLVTSDQLPDGDNRINTELDSDGVVDNLSSVFDPTSQNSVPAALTQLLTNNSDLLPNSGSDEEVKLTGTDADDILFAGAGDDELKGEKGNDILYGLGGDDKLEGKDGDDTFYGGTGNDEIKGGEDSDTITGVDPNSASAGRGEIDTMKGEKDGDRFVLGDSNQVYYNDGNSRTGGYGDYALIEDFKLKDGDVIQLKGSKNDYRLGSAPKDLKDGTGIFYLDGQTTPELIGIVKGVKTEDLSLNDRDVFTFV